MIGVVLCSSFCSVALPQGVPSGAVVALRYPLLSDSHQAGTRMLPKAFRFESRKASHKKAMVLCSGRLFIVAGSAHHGQTR